MTGIKQPGAAAIHLHLSSDIVEISTKFLSKIRSLGILEGSEPSIKYPRHHIVDLLRNVSSSTKKLTSMLHLSVIVPSTSTRACPIALLKDWTVQFVFVSSTESQMYPPKTTLALSMLRWIGYQSVNF